MMKKKKVGTKYSMDTCFIEISSNTTDLFTDEGWKEYLAILEDNRKLRQFAGFYLQPEKPVEVDATACARCYFSRNSAEEQTPAEDEEERNLVLMEAKNLKQSAVDYLHPERPVDVDPVAFGRNYFGRASAEPQESVEESEERKPQRPFHWIHPAWM